METALRTTFSTSVEGKPPATRFNATTRLQKMAFADGGPLHIPATAPKTLTEAFRKTAARNDKGLTIVSAHGENEVIGYADLSERAKRLLSGLREQGLRPGNRVILQIDSLADHFAAFWACVLGGIIPVTVAVPTVYSEKQAVAQKLCNIWKLLEAPAILTSAALLDSIRSLGKKMSMNDLIVLSIDELRNASPAESVHDALPDDVIFYQLTSGSTGTPKCIQETHRGIIAHIHGSQQCNGYSSDDVTLNWLPLDHVVPILTCHLKDVYLGANEIQVKTDYIVADPLRWFDLMHEHRVTHTWSPNFGFKLVADALAEGAKKQWDLSCVKSMMNAGEQVTPPVMEEFIRTAEPFGIREHAIQPAFGMAEVCTCMAYENHFDLKTSARRFAKHSLNDILEETVDRNGSVEFISLGPPVPGVQIRITDSANHLLREGKIGRLQIKGAVVTPGYLKNETANAEAFVGEEWFNTGDLGFILDGKLFITGREKEMIIIRCTNFYCYEIEDVVNRIEGIEPTFSAACAIEDPGTGSEGLAIFFVAKSEDDRGRLIPKIREQVAANMGITPTAIVPLEKKYFPKTTSGKIQRGELQRAFRAGEFQKAIPEVEQSQSSSPAPSSNIETQIVHIWREVLKAPKVATTDNFFALGGDSLRAFQILSRIRETFGVELPLPALFEEASTVNGMAECIGKARTSNQTAITEIHPVPGNEKLALSFPQQRLWILDQFEPGSPRYNVARGLGLNGPLDVMALERSLNEVVKRHEIFRTVFKLEKGEGIQVVLPELTIPLRRMDFGEIPPAQRNSRVIEASRKETAVSFDLAKGPLLRATLFRFSENESFLLLCFHQIVIDGWSVGVLFTDLAEYYRAFSKNQKPGLAPLHIQYADFAQWQRQSAKNVSAAQQLDYWKKQIAGKLPVLKWPSDHEVALTHDCETETVVLPKVLCEKIKAFSRNEGATLFMTLLAAYKALLRHLTNEEDILVGSAVSGRNRIETEKLIGFFVNTVVLRSRVDAQETFRNLIAQVRRVSLDGFANADLPFERLVEELRPDRRTANPIFQAWFSMMDAMKDFTLDGVTARPMHIPPKEAQFDFSLFMIERPDEVELHFEYKTDLFSATRVRNIISSYERLLREAVEEPDVKLAALFEKLNAPEGTKQVETIHKLIERQAEQTPKSVAVSCGNSSLTYAELNRRANQLAHYLRKRGVGPETLVGICTGRSVEMVIGILGILKAGGAYVPLDPNYPKERLQFMLAEINAPVLLTQSDLLNKIPPGKAKAFCIDSDWKQITAEPENNPAGETTEENLAYVIFTSGSTGKPKGVLVTHTNLVHSTKARFGFYQETPTAYLMISSFSFDSSIAGIFWTLSTGGNLILPEDGAHQDPQELIHLIEKHRASHFLALPSLYNLILQEARLQDLASLRAVIVAGESCPQELVERHAQSLASTSLYNEYGPTEGTVWSTAAKLMAGQSVTIGQAIPNVGVYILNEDLKPVPHGEIGEIFIGGAGVARGYLNRPDVTAQKFITDPINNEPTARLYRTGDLGRFVSDGNLEFLGRADNQIKIRGYRVELEEIESALGEFSGIHQVAVIAREQLGSAEKELAAYVVTVSGQPLKSAELRSFLQTKLPDYMVPGGFTFLEQMPLTPNGKVDRNALSAIEPQNEIRKEFVSPRTPVEEELAAIWGEVLRVEKVGIHDNFFDMGGHSLLAIQVGARIREKLNVQLALRHIFETPTIAALGEVVFQELLKSPAAQE